MGNVIKVQDVGEAGGLIQRVTQQVISAMTLFSSSGEDVDRHKQDEKSKKKRGPFIIYLSKTADVKEKASL